MYTLPRMLQRWTALALTVCFLLSAVGCSSVKKTKDDRKAQVVEQYLDTVSNSRYIMHALGGVDGTYSYTNSIDALEASYAEGARLFEVDISFTSDEQLVLAHSTTKTALSEGEANTWAKNDWEKRLGQPYDPDKPLASFDEFMGFTIQGRFKATSFAELLDFMEAHDDMFVMLDVGNRSFKATKKIYQAIVEAVGDRESILWHFIVGGHSTAAMNAVLEVYDFPIRNLYFSEDSKREEMLQKPEDFLQYCGEHGIQSFSVSCDRFIPELDIPDIISYVFTTDDEAEAKALFETGANIVGTNFLREKN